MFGIHDLPLYLEQNGISLSAELKRKNILYQRKYLDDNVNKIIMADHEKLLINPVEPVNTPKKLSSHLFIDFENILIVKPKETRKIYLTFPIEIGVYIFAKGNTPILDIFALTKQKFVLYGDPRNGVLCKYWKSPILDEKTLPNPIQEGIMELTLSNQGTEWVEVKKAIFNAYGMKLYYHNQIVSMKASMKLKGANLAETDFENRPLEKNMQKSLEIYTHRMLSVSLDKFVMEFGL
jgi:hypothetical protein